eukprot:5247669-Pyramimonas_sp.AAC.1
MASSSSMQRGFPHSGAPFTHDPGTSVRPPSKKLRVRLDRLPRRNSSCTSRNQSPWSSTRLQSVNSVIP